MNKKKLLMTAIVALTAILAVLLCACSLFSGLTSSTTTNTKPQYLDTPDNATVGNLVANNCIGAAVQVYAGTSAGSGFYISADGYIVTNHHVVSGLLNSTGRECVVKAVNGSSEKARIVAYDASRDVAVLKADVEGHDYLYFANSGNKANIYLGDTVYIIGNPADLGIIVSSGIVSNMSLYSGSTEHSYSFNSIVINSSINHGNSGGPMINANCAVVGLIFARFESPTAGEGQSSDIYGLGCAVPSAAIMAFLGENNIPYSTTSPYAAQQ